jgi:hypothetical protein
LSRPVPPGPHVVPGGPGPMTAVDDNATSSRIRARIIQNAIIEDSAC